VLEGRLAELVQACSCHRSVVSEHRARLNKRLSGAAITGRDHIIVMQGGYNGWHNDVSCTS
jgi:glutamate-1-semialdehyde 2,1-aminomutase